MRPRYPKKFLVELETAQYDALKAAAQSEGVAMADVLRDALDVWLRKLGPITPLPDAQPEPAAATL
jgi:hypothetical protein